jgi:hypothetical protein
VEVRQVAQMNSQHDIEALHGSIRTNRLLREELRHLAARSRYELHLAVDRLRDRPPGKIEPFGWWKPTNDPT